MTQLQPQARPIPPQNSESVFPEHLVCGTLFMEVVLPGGRAPTLPVAPFLAGWTLRLWPQARLGDATLEARASGSQDAGDLIAGLKSQGVQILGPVLGRRSQPRKS